MTLTDFLLARIAEDEAEVSKWLVSENLDVAGWYAIRGPEVPRPVKERALAKCETARRVALEYADIDPEGNMRWDESPAGGYGEGLLLAVRHIALPYAEHPDYRQEWKP